MNWAWISWFEGFWIFKFRETWVRSHLSAIDGFDAGLVGFLSNRMKANLFVFRIPSCRINFVHIGRWRSGLDRSGIAPHPWPSAGRWRQPPFPGNHLVLSLPRQMWRLPRDRSAPIRDDMFKTPDSIRSISQWKRLSNALDG